MLIILKIRLSSFFFLFIRRHLKVDGYSHANKELTSVCVCVFSHWVQRRRFSSSRKTQNNCRYVLFFLRSVFSLSLLSEIDERRRKKTQQNSIKNIVQQGEDDAWECLCRETYLMSYSIKRCSLAKQKYSRKKKKGENYDKVNDYKAERERDKKEVQVFLLHQNFFSK